MHRLPHRRLHPLTLTFGAEADRVRHQTRMTRDELRESRATHPGRVAERPARSMSTRRRLNAAYWTAWTPFLARMRDRYRKSGLFTMVGPKWLGGRPWKERIHRWAWVVGAPEWNGAMEVCAKCDAPRRGVRTRYCRR
jgi:hypothetical protein